jgi:hypothetical protein
MSKSQVKFSAEAFLRDLNAGRFDGRLREELGKLTPQQLQEVSRLMASHINKKHNTEGTDRDALSR